MRFNVIKPLGIALAACLIPLSVAHATPVDESILKLIPPASETPPEVLAQIPPDDSNSLSIQGLSSTSSGLTQAQLIGLGEYIFNNVTFDGNGRTCATCHPATNNFTIDPKYIAQLPPYDPLFVAETNPDLKDLENPKLMRQLGLIKENLDGFDKPGVMRGVPSILAISTSRTPETGFPSAHSIGWSGDGAPGDGSLRMFAVGAVVQHATKTLARQVNVDFRLPTELELDALAAFQMSLGRQQEIDLNTLSFQSSAVEQGKILFNSRTEGGKCKRCHDNAGANSSTSGFNGNRDTGVEDLPSQMARLIDPTTPRDSGLGTAPNSKGGWGDGTFNMTTVIESADTAPFFHNNSISTLEQAVAFYNSDAFNNSSGGIGVGGIHMEPSEVVAIGAFLRSMSALENMRNANLQDRKAMDPAISTARSMALIEIALSDTQDAIEVLQGTEYAFYNGEEIHLLNYALWLESWSMVTSSSTQRNAMLEQAIALKTRVINMMLKPNSSALAYYLG